MKIKTKCLELDVSSFVHANLVIIEGLLIRYAPSFPENKVNERNIRMADLHTALLCPIIVPLDVLLIHRRSYIIQGF